MQATVCAPLQGLRMETGWVSLTQAAGLGCVRAPLWGWEARAPTRGAPTLPGSAAMYTEGTASRPPTSKGQPAQPARRPRTNPHLTSDNLHFTVYPYD
jgi:hypothetical protein